MTLDLEYAVEMATERLAELTAEADRLTLAAGYMQQLLDLIAQHPLLQEEWEMFLIRAELTDLAAKL